MKNLKISYIAVLLLSFLSFSCGGGSDTQMASGGIGGTGISQGPITEFGSIFVNGVQFDTTEATVTIDDQSASANDLDLGMFVTVKGTIDPNGLTGKAQTIDFEEDVKGPIDSIDIPSNTLVVMEQTVRVDSRTQFKEVSGFSALQVNDMLKVSGLPAANGIILATLIEVESEPFIPNQTQIEMIGTIQGLDTDNKIFFIGSQKVNYSGASFEDMIESDLINGLLLEAEGTRDLDGVLNATRIEKEEALPELEEGIELELDGFVTSFTNPSIFSVSSQAVETTSETSFKDGFAGDIALNVHLEVEGTVNAEGVLIAEKISFPDNEDDSD